jgi:hypothetical protein
LDLVLQFYTDFLHLKEHIIRGSIHAGEHMKVQSTCSAAFVAGPKEASFSV